MVQVGPFVTTGGTMRSTSLIGIGALTTAALLGTCFTATAHAAVGGGDGRSNVNELHGYRIVSEIFTVPATPNAPVVERTVFCPAGGKVTGGGVRVTDARTTGQDAAVQATFPTQNGDGWVGAATTGTGTGAVTMTVYAICTKVGDEYRDKY
jgi:hypothetical protein